MPRRLVIAIAAVAAVAASARATSQQQAPQQPTFRAGTRTVPIYVSVTDEIGQFVQQLTRDDFEVKDDGKVQAITLFTTDVQPITAVILLDASRSMVKALDTVITAADHLVVRLGTGDRARVGSFSEEIRFGPFTSDRDELARQVNDLFDLRVGPVTRLWDAIEQATASFESSQGRRVIVVFTDGDDTWSTNTFSDALSRARRADVMVYGVLIRGLERLPEERVRRPRSPDFSELALDTGGGYYLVNNVLDDMNSIATQITEELHSQYVLGFTPQQLDGKVHSISVRVKHPKMKVRSRQTYLAEPDALGGGRQ